MFQKCLCIHPQDEAPRRARFARGSGLQCHVDPGSLGRECHRPDTPAGFPALAPALRRDLLRLQVAFV